MSRSQPQLRSTRTYQMDAVHAVRYPGLASPLAPDMPIMADHATRPRLNRLVRALSGFDFGLHFPDSPRALAVYTLVTGTVCIALLLHVMLSAQIMQAEVRIRSLQAELDTINRQNDEILWQIARATNLTRIQERALALGYVPIRTRQYVVMSADQPSLTLAHPDTDAARPLTDAGAITQNTIPQASAGAWLPAWLQDFKLNFDLSATTPPVASSGDAATSGDAASDWQAWWDQLLEQGAAKAQQWFSN